MSDDFKLDLSEEKRDEMGEGNPTKLHKCELAIDRRASAIPSDPLRKGSK